MSLACWVDIGICRQRRDDIIIVVAGINRHADPDLTEIVHAGGSLGPFLGARQRGQQHRRQNRDDGNYHQQFDQREGPPAIAP